MKPTDSNQTPETATIPELANSPVVSRLKRVVDMTSLSQAKVRANSATSNQHKKNNTKSQNQPQKQPRQSKDRRRPTTSPTNAQPKPTDEPIKSAPEPQPRFLRRSGKDQKQNIQPDSEIKTPDKATQPIPPSDNHNQNDKSTSTRRIRATHPIRAHHSLHISEKNISNKKERISLKAHKQTVKSNDISSPALHHPQDKAIEKIEEALLLQSWRARLWSENIGNLSKTILSNLTACMPIVQAKLVNNICITPGRLEATVVDEIATISLKQFTPGQWRSVISMLSDRAIFITSLLNGELPEGILDIFKQASLSLFPTKLRDFSFSCSCDSVFFPCKHASALLLAFAVALEEDPFHILTLRGLPREILLSQLRDARSDQVLDEKNRYRINYEIPAQNIDFNEFYSPKGNFEDINFHISRSENALLKRLGDPAPWRAPITVDSIIVPIVDIASQEAVKLGLNERTCPIDEIVEQPPRAESRAPKKNARSQRISIPNLDFVEQEMDPEILNGVSGNPVDIAADILRWLKSRGASDIRTLARRTRLHKPTIEAFLNVLSKAGLARSEGENDHMRFYASF